MNSHNSLSNRYSLLVLTKAIKQPDATFNSPRPISQLLNRHGPILRLSFLSFFTAALILTFNMMVDRELLTVGVRLLEDSKCKFVHLV